MDEDDAIDLLDSLTVGGDDGEDGPYDGASYKDFWNVKDRSAGDDADGDMSSLGKRKRQFGPDEREMDDIRSAFGEPPADNSHGSDDLTPFEKQQLEMATRLVVYL